MNMSDDFPMLMEREAGTHERVPPVAVAFGMYAMVDGAKSKDAGRDIYKEVEFVKIAIPGDKNSNFFQPSTDVYRRRFPRAYEAFKARNQGAAIEGTPIEQWAAVSRSVALNLRSAHIHTVEALAAVHEGNVDRIGLSNARELRDKARAWLASAKDSAETLRLAAEKKALQDELAAMKAQIAALSGRTPAHDDAEAAKIEAAKSAEAARKLTDDLDASRDLIDAQSKLIAALEAGDSQPKARRGRPPKSADADAA